MTLNPTGCRPAGGVTKKRKKSRRVGGITIASITVGRTTTTTVCFGEQSAGFLVGTCCILVAVNMAGVYTKAAHQVFVDGKIGL